MACLEVILATGAIALDWQALATQLVLFAAAGAAILKLVMWAVNGNRDLRRISLIVTYLRRLDSYLERRALPGERLPPLHLDPDEPRGWEEEPEGRRGPQETLGLANEEKRKQ